MSVAYLGEKIFLQEILAGGEVWVARGLHKYIYTQEIENYSLSLPAWSTREKIAEFLKITRLGQRFTPRAIPLEDFANRWLSDKMMGIAEVQINPLGTETRVLALTSEEFQAKVAVAAH